MSIAIPAIPIPYIHSTVKRRKNTWYSISDGNWSNPNTWMSNGLRRLGNYPGQAIPNPIFPQVGDDVYINNNVTADTTLIVNNLRVSGKLAFASSITITVYGDIQATGTVDMSTSLNPTLQLYGVNNGINTFICGTSSTVIYIRNGGQTILPITYYNLYIYGNGYFPAVGDMTINGNLRVCFNAGGSIGATPTFELSSYNITVSGSTTIYAGGILSKSGSGNMLFVGVLGAIQFSTTISLTGNPNIEFRGGINNYIYPINFGTGTITFTTNSQTITQLNSGISTIPNATIVGAITVTNAVGGGAFLITGAIDGTVSGSALVNKGSLYLGSTTLPMATHGTWDYTTYTTNTLGFVINSSYAVPYTTFTGNLLVSGTGTKSLSGATTVGGNLFISNAIAACTFDPGYNLTVTGYFTINSSFFICTTTSLSFLFIGGMVVGAYPSLDFSTGNPNVEVRGATLQTPHAFNTGTGTWTFSVNNITIIISSPGGNIFNCPILISGAITVTITGTQVLILNGAINGNNSNSILDNRITGIGAGLSYQNAAAPMITGKLYCNQAANTFVYGASGNQDIQVPSDPTPGYNNLTLNGSGAKKLLGNVSVKGTYLLVSPATLDSNGYSLTNP